MNLFRSFFLNTFRATVPGRCILLRRRLCAEILEAGWANGQIVWDQWTESDLAAISLMLGDIQEALLADEIRQQLGSRRVLRTRGQGDSTRLTGHLESPWSALQECSNRLQGSDDGLAALEEILRDTAGRYVNFFARLLGIWPFSDVRPFLNVSAPDPISLRTLLGIAVTSSFTPDLLTSVDRLPGRVVYNLLKELGSIAGKRPPEWWDFVSGTEQNLLAAVNQLPPNMRFVFFAVNYGGLTLAQIVAVVNERGAVTDESEAFLTLRSAWQEVLPVF